MSFGIHYQILICALASTTLDHAKEHFIHVKGEQSSNTSFVFEILILVEM